MNESRCSLYRSAGLGLFIGLGFTALLLLLAGCSPEVHAQPTIPPSTSSNLISSYSGIFNLRAGNPSVSLPATITTPKRGVTKLAWDASPDISVAGYKVYWGTNSKSYPHSLTVGTNLTATINGLSEGVRYYFAVTAHDAIGVESMFSNEATNTTGFYVSLQMKVWEVSSFGAPGQTNLMQTSTNLSDWWTFKTWIGNGVATNALHTNSAKSYFRVMVK